MHLLITDAAPPAPPALDRLAGIDLPHLQALLRLLQAAEAPQDSPETLNTLAEQLHARALGLTVADGLHPWAALLAREHGQQPLHPAANGTGSDPQDAGAREGWALITPCHWKVHSDHVHMAAVDSLRLTPADNAALLAAMGPYFAEDGITLSALPDGRWLARAAVFKGLATASLQRASDARVDTWLPRAPQARPLRRLQNEMQMLLYTHPVNDARASQGLPEINSFWVSGTGDLPPDWQPPATPVKTVQLAALTHPGTEQTKDAVDCWLDGWQKAHASEILTLLQLAEKARDAQAQATLSLTLSGPRGARVYRLLARSPWVRMRQLFTKPDIGSILNSL